MASVFEGLKVLDFSWGMAGSLATMILADYGGDVVKVEPPGGAPDRSQPAFLLWNRGKRSVVIDLKTDQGHEQALALARVADVVVETFRPGVAEGLGIGYEQVSAINPQVVYCSISGFGQKGPYRNLKGYEGVVNAKAGRMKYFTGQLQREGPAYVAVPVASFGAANQALHGILAALIVRERTGQGQWVQTSLLQGEIPPDPSFFLTWQLARRDPKYAPRETDRSLNMTLFAARCKDGRWIQFHNQLNHLFYDTLRVMGLEDLAQDPRYWDLPRVPDEQAMVELRDTMLKRMLEKTSDEWLEIFNATQNVSGDLLRTAEEALDHPQMIHNGQVIELDDPRVGKTRQVGPLVMMPETPARITRPAPDLGQHNHEVLLEWGSSTPSAVPARNGAPLTSLPLEGITILDLTAFVAAPLAGALLADLGARVIKIEPLDGEPFRHVGLGVSTVKTTQGKESIALDLKRPEAQKILHQLIAKADVILYSFRPGVPERLGFGHDTVRAINPRIIIHYAGTYGNTGPYYHRPGFHGIAGAIGGGALAQAGKGTPPPPATPMTHDEIVEVWRRMRKANEHNADPNSALGVATGMMLALLARERLGISQTIQTTMMCTNTYANSEAAIVYEGKPPRQLADENLMGPHALYRLYRAREGWVFLACPQEEEWESLCSALGRRDLLEDTRFRNSAVRKANDTALAQILEGCFRGRTADEWEEFLTAKDIACVRADHANFGEFFNVDPSMKEIGLMVEVVHPTLGQHFRYGHTVNLSKTPGKLGPGCESGQHTQVILRELGYSEEEIQELKSGKIVEWPEFVAEQVGLAKA